MKKEKIIRVTVMLAVVLFLSFAGGTAVAKEEKAASYNVNFSLAENLSAFKGKTVYVHLKSGQTLTGIVKAVGNHLVHLEKLSGKDFYDALVRLDDVSAIDARFR